MLRIIDMREVTEGIKGFAVWDTCPNKFVMIEGEQSWDDEADFRAKAGSTWSGWADPTFNQIRTDRVCSLLPEALRTKPYPVGIAMSDGGVQTHGFVEARGQCGITTSKITPKNQIALWRKRAETAEAREAEVKASFKRAMDWIDRLKRELKGLTREPRQHPPGTPLYQCQHCGNYGPKKG